MRQLTTATITITANTTNANVPDGVFITAGLAPCALISKPKIEGATPSRRETVRGGTKLSPAWSGCCELFPRLGGSAVSEDSSAKYAKERQKFFGFAERRMTTIAPHDPCAFVRASRPRLAPEVFGVRLILIFSRTSPRRLRRRR